MSLRPILFDFEDLYSDPWPLRRHYHRSPTNDFALGIHPRDLQHLLSLPLELRQIQQRARDLQQRQGGKTEVAPTTGKDGFQVCMDVQQFSPNEISVKAVDNCILIEGKHEERQDEHGFISRQFTRRYALPKGYDAGAVTSTLSSDGVLTIKAPPPKGVESNERVISIQQTGPARLNVKENKAEEEKKTEE
jgi:HSP20 family molecular chaperone IbpA